MDSPSLNKASEIKDVNSKSMTLSNGDVWQFISGKPPGWAVGDRVIVKRNNDPAPGGPARFRPANLLEATNLTKGGAPVSVTSAGSVNPPEKSSSINKSCSVDDVKLEKKYIIQEIYPDEHSFRLECGKFIIDLLSIPKNKRFDYGEDDIIVLYPSATALGKKNKFKAVNKSREDQEAGVMFLEE